MSSDIWARGDDSDLVFGSEDDNESAKPPGEGVTDLGLSDPADQARRTAMDAAVRMLALREHAAGELAQKLCRKGHDADVVDQVLEELQRLDLQSDARFVDSFFRGRLSKGHGPIRIRHDLAQKGVSEPLVEEALTQHAEFWLELAEQVRCKRFGEELPRGEGSDWTAQARFLAQRGFPSDLIYRVLGSRY